MMIKKFSIYILGAVALLSTGCANKNSDGLFSKSKEKEATQIPTTLIKKESHEKKDNIIDMGQYAEAWIAPYKDKEGNLFVERKLYFWVKEPDFVIGEKVPGANNKNEKSTSNESLYHTKFNIKFDKKNIQNNEDENTEIDDNKMELDSSVKEFLMKNKEEINE